MSITLRAKRILTGALAGALVLGLLPAGVASANTDVCDGASSAGFADTNGTFQSDIDCAVGHGIMTGQAGNVFNASGNMTRGQMATALVNFVATAKNVAVSTLPTGAHTFEDVAGTTHEDNIARAFAMGIIKGRDATTFDPGSRITRAAAATMIANAHVSAQALNMDLSGVVPYTNFTDLGNSVHAPNINVLAAAGVITGVDTAGTTFAPNRSVTRGQVAAMVIRAANLVVAPNGLWNAPALVASAAVTVVSAATGNDFDYADPATKAAKTATVKDTDSFTVDGVASSKATFLAAVSIGDQVVIGTNSYALTNVTRTAIRSGTVSFAAATEFSIIDPITGTDLRGAVIDWDGDHTVYSVDGVNVSATAFAAAINTGDTVSVTGGTAADFATKGTAANPRTIALTNQTVTGTVSAVTVAAGPLVVGTTLSIKSAAGATVAVPAFATGDVVTIDGAAATADNIEEISIGDTVSYSRNGGIKTVAVTNVASTPLTGVVAGNIPAVTGQLQFFVGAQTTVTSTVDNVEDYNLRLGGIAVTPAEFVAALTPGDQVVVQEADGKIVTKGTLTLTNQALTGYVSSVTAPATVDVAAVLKSDFSYEQQLIGTLDTSDAASLFTGNTTISRTVNGASATEAVYNAELLQIAQGYKTGVITVADSGTATNISLTTTVTGAATLVNAVHVSDTEVTLTFDKPVHVTDNTAIDVSAGTITSIAPSTAATASVTVTITGTGLVIGTTLSVNDRLEIRSSGDVPAAKNGAVFTL